MSSLRGAWGMTRLEGVGNESVYDRWNIGTCVHGMKCGIMECVKNSLRWLGHIVRMNSEVFVKKRKKKKKN